MNIIKNAILNTLLNNFMSHMYSTTCGCSISKFILEGLANMTIPKTIGRLYRAVFKCMYNNKVFDVIFLKEGRLSFKSLKQLSLNYHHGKGLYHLTLYCWWLHLCHKEIINS